MLTILENESFSAKISSHGAELYSLYDKVTNIECIWQGDKNYWSWHAPICFPITGRVHNDKYTFEKKEYMLTVHGFARDCDFTLLKKTENSVSYELRYNSETFKKYPFKFSLIIEYKLLNTGISVNYIVNNLEENKDIYFSIGLHTAYNCPLLKTDDLEDYELIFENDENCKRYFLVNGILSKKTEDLLNNEHILSLNKEFFARDIVLLKDIKSEYVILKSKKTDAFIKVSYNNFKHIGFWTKPQGAPFICIEPWNGMADIEDEYVDFSEKQDILKLKKQESFECSYKIETK